MKGLKRVLPVFAFLACLAVIGGVGFVAHNALYGPKPAPKHLELTKDNFQKEVSAKGLVYFYVCTEDRYACEVQSKAVDEFADKYGAQVKVAFIDAATQPELVQQLGIQSAMELPAHFVVSDGKLVGAVSGVFSSDELAGLITQMLQNPQQETPQQGGTTNGTTNGGTGTGTDATPPASTTPAPSGK
jgi:thioredoxin-like negative regulator of GroEL